MRPRSLIMLLSLLFAGCTSPRQREADAEARGYERGRTQAMKEQYWIIQNQQRRPVEAPQSPNP